MPKTKDSFKYHASFASKLRCPISKESGKLLAKASVEDLKTILPEIAQQEGWDDLLPVAGNACVVNYANKNRDAINTAAAVAMAPYFADKFINVEHDRDVIIGFIKNASFSTFNANYMLGSGSEAIASDDAAKMNGPFNLALGGVVWRVVAPSVAKKIEECNNPDSPDFLTLGMSWELGFDSYAIAVGPQNLEECKIISDENEVEAMSKYLIQNKGPGKLDDGSPVYRLITEASGAVPLGIGLTFSPAAAVTGVITPDFETIAAENKEKISQSETIDVTTIKNTTDTPSMKILTTLAEVEALNDSNKAEYSVANLKALVRAETVPLLDLEKTVTEYQQKIDAEKSAKQKVIDDAKAASEKALAESAATNEKYENLKKQFEELLKKQTEAESTAAFNDRMQAIDDEYELDDAQRASIAGDIRSLDDVAYANWFKSFSNFANKSKKVKEENKSDDVKNESKAAVETAKKNASTASTVNNNPTAAAASLVEKMRGAFSSDNLKVTANSRRS